MTEPEDQPQDAADAGEAPTAEQASVPPVTPAAAAPQHQLAPGQPFGAQPYPQGYFAPYPFAPVAKEPWFNPAKRTTILITSIVLAVVLLGGGALIGAVASHHGDRERGVGFYGPLQVPRGGKIIGPRIEFPGQGNHPGRGNGFGRGPGTAPSGVPGVPGGPGQSVPSASSSATS